MLEVAGVSKTEGNNKVVAGVSFHQSAFQKLAIAGATGSGKTTLLKMIAGLTQPDEGTILFNGEPVKGPNEKLIPGHPAIAYLSQHFELRNHYRVEELLAMANTGSEEEALRTYRICCIDHLLKRWTHQLSGGEKQRIALARLLVTSPKLLLLDKPFSNLDPFHKNVLKKVIENLSAELNISCILISHDPLDTLSWADKIIIMRDGEIIQKGDPGEIYSKPVSVYAAELFGKFNELSAPLISVLKPGTPFQAPVIVRPEPFKITASGLEATVKAIKFMGSYYEAELIALDKKIIIHTYRTLTAGEKIYLSM